MKKNLCTFMVATMMIVATLFVSCTPQSNARDNDTVSVFFGELQAKTGINSDVYDTATTPEDNFGAGVVNGKSVSDLYWSYSATKKDGNFTSGQTDGFVAVKDGAGLDATIEGLAKGDWQFTLRAFTSAEDRTAGEPVIYEGSSDVINLTNANTINTVDIATEYMNPSGSGNAPFTIKTVIKQTATTDESLYSVSKVTVQYDGQSEPVELKAGTPSTVGEFGSEQTTTTEWSDTVEDIPNGLRTFTYKVYVSDDEVTDAGAEATAVVMTNLNTAITGTATITLTVGTVDVNFSGSGTPDDQPDIDSSDSGNDSTEEATGVAYNVTKSVGYSSFKEAVDNADEDDVIKLMENIDLTGDVT